MLSSDIIGDLDVQNELQEYLLTYEAPDFITFAHEILDKLSPEQLSDFLKLLAKKNKLLHAITNEAESPQLIVPPDLYEQNKLNNKHFKTFDGITIDGEPMHVSVLNLQGTNEITVIKGPIADFPNPDDQIAKFAHTNSSNYPNHVLNHRWVHPDYRGIGLSSMIIKLYEDDFKLRGEANICLEIKGIETICWALAHDYTLPKDREIQSKVLAHLLEGWNGMPHTDNEANLGQTIILSKKLD